MVNGLDTQYAILACQQLTIKILISSITLFLLKTIKHFYAKRKYKRKQTKTILLKRFFFLAQEYNFL